MSVKRIPKSACTSSQSCKNIRWAHCKGLNVSYERRSLIRLCGCRGRSLEAHVRRYIAPRCDSYYHNCSANNYISVWHAISQGYVHNNFGQGEKLYSLFHRTCTRKYTTWHGQPTYLFYSLYIATYYSMSKSCYISSTR